jgi:hypothetical protein
MNTWRIWEYATPLIQVLPASGETAPIRRGYLIQRKNNSGIQYTELAPLESFHGISRSECLNEFLNYVHDPDQHTNYHSVTQMAIDILDLPTSEPVQIPINALVDLRFFTEDHILQEHQSIKIKLGRQPIDTEIRDFFKLIKSLPEQTTFRIDANRAWSIEKLQYYASQLPLSRIEYFEDPLCAPEEYTKIKNIPIVLDETMQNPLHVQLLEQPNIIGAVLKPSLLGGLKATDKLIKGLYSQNKLAILSSTFESSLGMWGIASLAHPNHVHGLGTLRWFKQHLFEDPLMTSNGYLLQSHRPQHPNHKYLTEIPL